MTGAARVFRPNEAVAPSTLRLLVGVQVAIGLVLWGTAPLPLIPSPVEVWQALPGLWTDGLGFELWQSFLVNAEALAVTVVVSLACSYLTVLPLARPVAQGISKLRFLGLVGLTLVFTLMLSGGHALKVGLLSFGMTVFFVTSMSDEIARLPRERFDHARTLRMGEWRVVYEVVVLGLGAQAFDVLRQNAAIGWMMLSTIEGLVRSEGGVGAMLLAQSKHLHLAEVFAIQASILMVGILQDYSLGALKGLVCPHAGLNLERR